MENVISILGELLRRWFPVTFCRLNDDRANVAAGAGRFGDYVKMR